ncbi:MAG: hypothetical protein ACFFCD_02440 [Promethearchaeota archaeon]
MSSSISLLVKNKLDTSDRSVTLEIDPAQPLNIIKEILHEEFDIPKSHEFVFLLNKKVVDDKKAPEELKFPKKQAEIEIKMKVSLQKIKQMKKELYLPSETDFPYGVIVVENKPAEVTRKHLVETAADFVIQAMQDPKNAAFKIPSRSSENIGYDENTQMVLLGNQQMIRAYRSLGSVLSVAQMARLMKLIDEQLSKKLHTTKRDLFYRDVNLFRSQDVSDNLIEDLAVMLGVTRASLNVVASTKGIVVGRISFNESGDFIDCTKMGVGGKAITPMIDQITDLDSDAEFILVVEKEAAFMRLAEDRFYDYIPSIIITGKGQPDMATRMFIKLIRKELQLPVLGLMDADPYGLDILRVYTIGSKALSFETNEMAVSDIKWLGLLPSDLDEYQIPKNCRIPMSSRDKKRGEDMLKEEFVKARPRWVEEIKLMLSTGMKAEIQALAHEDIQFMTNSYLPTKIHTGDWV